MDKKQKMTIYFVRHGQSIDNALPVFQSVNSPLSKKGERQAESIANRLTHVQFDALIASPLPRAHETAQYIAKKTNKDIELSNLFVERMKPTEVDGKPWSDKEAAKVWEVWEKTLYSTGSHISDGENYDDLVSRVDRALAFLQARDDSTIVVVTHGYFLRAIVARVLVGENLNGAIMKRFQEHASIENTAITVLNYSSRNDDDFTWRLWTLNDHAHFAE